MDRRIVGFGRDEEGLWVAELECGHRQRGLTGRCTRAERSFVITRDRSELIVHGVARSSLEPAGLLQAIASAPALLASLARGLESHDPCGQVP